MDNYTFTLGIVFFLTLLRLDRTSRP